MVGGNATIVAAARKEKTHTFQPPPAMSPSVSPMPISVTTDAFFAAVPLGANIFAAWIAAPAMLEAEEKKKKNEEKGEEDEEEKRFLSVFSLSGPPLSCVTFFLPSLRLCPPPFSPLLSFLLPPTLSKQTFR